MLLISETETCETLQVWMTALLDNELAPADAAYLRTHLALCPDCTQVFDKSRKTLQAADAWKVDGPDIWQALEKRISSESNTPDPVSESTPEMTHRTRWLSEKIRSKNVMTAEELTEALYVSKKTARDLAEVVIDLGYADERQIAEWRAQAEGLQFIDLTKHKPEASALFVLPSSVARRHNVLPVKKDGSKLWVAMVNPRDIDAVDAIRMVTRCQVAPLLAVPADLEKAMAEAYPVERPVPTDQVTSATNPANTESQDDLRAVLTEMRALRTEIQELRGEVGTLRRLLSMTQQTIMRNSSHPLPPEWMPVASPENRSIGLL